MAHSVKRRALFQLSAETPLPWPLLPPLLLWPHCGDVCWSWPLFLVWVSEGLQANCALPKSLQQTVETLVPSHRPFHCVNICASRFSQEETEAQISVLKGGVCRRLAHGDSLSKKNTSRYSSLPHPRQLLPQRGAPPSDLGPLWCLACLAAGSSCAMSAVDGSSLHAGRPLCRLWSSTQVCQVNVCVTG